SRMAADVGSTLCHPETANGRKVSARSRGLVAGLRLGACVGRLGAFGRARRALVDRSQRVLDAFVAPLVLRAGVPLDPDPTEAEGLQLRTEGVDVTDEHDRRRVRPDMRDGRGL